MDFYMMFENNYTAVYKRLSEKNPDSFDPTDSDPGPMNCGFYTAALLEILGKGHEETLITESKKLEVTIETHLIRPNAFIELNINEPDEHWSLVINIPNTSYCAYFETDRLFNRSVRIMPISTFRSYIVGTLTGEIPDSFYGATVKNREFTAYMSFTNEMLTAETIGKFIKSP